MELILVRIPAPRRSVRNVTLKNARRDIVKVNVRRPAPYAKVNCFYSDMSFL